MQTGQDLERIVGMLRTRYGCHTVILYGSHARGENTVVSDYDLAGFRKGGRELRVARLWQGVYLDVFIYPESRLREDDSSLLRMRNGRVLCQKRQLGSRFLAHLQKLFHKGRKKLRPDEIRALKVWARKMIDRARAGDVEGDYRRTWLLTSLLEDYFLIRSRWYLGPKESLAWLRTNAAETYDGFRRALRPGASLRDIEELAERVVGGRRLDGRKTRKKAATSLKRCGRR